MQSGELIVVGQNSINISLSGIPNEVRVFFKDDVSILAPCNPGDADTLEYTTNLNTGSSDFVLFITWNVSSIREIIWRVAY
jgi:hypothetical protein